MAEFAKEDGAETDATADETTEDAATDEPKEKPAATICASPGCGKPAAMACPNCLKLSKEQCSECVERARARIYPASCSHSRLSRSCGFSLSLYCAQPCFKAHWATHKQVHKLWQAAIAAQKQTMPPGFEYYSFTGPLRPSPYGPSRMGSVPKKIKYPDYAGDSMPRSEIDDKRANRGIPVYTAVEIEGIRNACRIGREVLDLGGRAVRKGVTCDEIDRVVHEVRALARVRVHAR